MEESLSKMEEDVPKTNADDPKTKMDNTKTADEEKNEKKPPTSHRKRKRAFLNSIRAQMEFYFGDANLSKDRFLKKLIDEDPYVPLEIFLTFNKIKQLTLNVKDIAKCLSNSQLLELDENQEKVRRKAPLLANRDADNRTLYVECLPPNADHDWVRGKFEQFGTIEYVSLPRYAKSRKIKEFGFIEFAKPEFVAKAVAAFTAFNGVLNMEISEPGELESVKAFIKEQKEEVAENDADVKSEIKKESKTKIKTSKKRSARIEEDTNPDDEPKAKKIKTQEETEIEKFEMEGNTTASETAEEDNKTNDEALDDGKKIESATKKKRRKMKKKLNMVEKQQKEAELNMDGFYQLKILPKQDWKRLRNKYLNMQREMMKQLKRKAWKEQQTTQLQTSSSSDNNKTSPEITNDPSPAKKSKPNERNLHKINMNFYGAGTIEGDEQKEAAHKYPPAAGKETKQNLALERTPLFTYAPGLIVEVSFLQPCVDVKEFKTDMRQYPTVKYVDVKEGAMQAQLRLESSQTAEEFAARLNSSEYQCKILSGDAENEYWKKIERDREMKLNNQLARPKKRGRERMKKLIANHLRFGDEDLNE